MHFFIIMEMVSFDYLNEFSLFQVNNKYIEKC